MVVNDDELKIPMHGLIVVGEGARGEVRSNCAPLMVHGALRVFIQSHAIVVPILQVVVRISVPALSGKSITPTAHPGLGHRYFR